MIPSGAVINGHHTYNDLGLIPCHKLIVAPSQPKYIIFDIPGRSASIDVTEALYDGIPYSTRKGQWEFLVLSGENYMQAYTNCLSVFNGERVEIVLDDEPGVTYTGRLSIDSWKSRADISKIVVSYNIDPEEYEDDP